MATELTVILFQRRHIGNQPGTFNDVEPNVQFVGPTLDLKFDCPNVNAHETAILMFQSRGVSARQKNVFQVNDVDVSGGLPASPSKDTWNGNILLLEPRHELKATGNRMHIKAQGGLFEDGEFFDNLDDFILDNVVILYKTL